MPRFSWLVSVAAPVAGAFLGCALAFVSPALAAEPVPVPVLAHPVARGDLIAASDFEAQPRPPGYGTGALSPTAAAGHEAARNLSAGMVVRAGDIVTPRLVRRGEPVTISLRSGGVVITTAGRALSAGGMGDLVRVVAPATGRTFDTVVEGSDAVRISAP